MTAQRTLEGFRAKHKEHHALGHLQLLLLAVATAACPGTSVTGKCLHGVVLRRVTTADATACCAACSALTGCKGWQFGKICKGCSPDTPCMLNGVILSAYDDNCTSGYPAGMPAPLPAPKTSSSVELASLFAGSEAVLQQHANVAVWGTSTADAGTTIAISLDGETVTSAFVAADGHWLAHLPPQPTSWARTLRATDVMSGAHNETAVKFGHALLCSGQRCALVVRCWLFLPPCLLCNCIAQPPPPHTHTRTHTLPFVFPCRRRSS